MTALIVKHTTTTELSEERRVAAVSWRVG